MVGQEPNVTAREALLRWARRSTARYPGVRVTDFTGSWRDGLAFSALLHRNRPDLVDWRTARSNQPRERLDRVFYVAEREYGVTRLLDPEGNDRLSIWSSLATIMAHKSLIPRVFCVDSRLMGVLANIHLSMMNSTCERGAMNSLAAARCIFNYSRSFFFFSSHKETFHNTQPPCPVVSSLVYVCACVAVPAGH